MLEQGEIATEQASRERVIRRELETLEIDPTSVDADSPVPTYLQIEQDLRRQIQESPSERDIRLPRETELAKIYGVSRMTLRNALARLEESALIRREHGVGTLVNPQRAIVTCDLSLMKRLQSQISDQGFVPGVTPAQQRIVVPVGKVRDALAMSDADHAFYYERILTVDARPTALIRSWVSRAAFPRFGDWELTENSIWQTLAVKYDVKIVRTSNFMELVDLSALDAHQLGLTEGERTICLTGTAFDAGDRPVEFSVALWGRHARVHFDARS